MTPKIGKFLNSVLALGCSLLLLPVQATTLLSLPIDEVAARAELIFEGEVLAHSPQRDPFSGQIYTTVSFSVQELIKGDYADAILELRFSGGSVGNERLEIPGLTLPAVGETGIYFIESVSQNMINPLLGWSQGHYLISEQGGQRLIQTNSGQAILEVQAATAVPATIRRPQRLIDGGSDAAEGIVTGESALSQSQPLTAEQFKSRIRSLLTP